MSGAILVRVSLVPWDYADDIVLIAPKPDATRKLLAICDEFAAQYDIVFNAEESNLLLLFHTIHDLCQMTCLHVICTLPVN